MNLLLRVGLGDARMNEVLLAIVAELDAALGSEVVGYYVEGSQADGTAAAGSDVDLTLVVAERAPDDLAELARGIARRAGEPRGVEVDLDVFRIEEMGAGLPPQLKLGGLHVYGDDVRDRFPLVPIDAWTRDRMHTSYWRVASLFGRPKVVRTPLDYPEPAGELFGYDGRRIRLADGREVPGTRDLVRHTGWMATALVALRAGRHVARKRDVPAAYREAIGDAWTDWLEELHLTCRQRWRYRIPKAPKESAQLCGLCARALGFERNFLAIYRAYLLRELRSPDVEAQLAALRPLAYAPWLDGEVERAVRDLSDSASGSVREAACTAIDRYERALATDTRP